MGKRTRMMPGGAGPVPADLRIGRFNPDREGRVLEVILDGRTDGTNQGIFEYLKSHRPPGYDGKIRPPTVYYFTRRATEAGIIERVGSGSDAVYVPLENGPAFARATPTGLAFRRKVLSGQPAHSEWLMYWRRQEAADVLDAGLLLSIGSNQLRRVKPGDTIWIACSSADGGLEAIGRIHVGQVVTRSVARKLLPYEPYKRDWHAIAAEGTAAAPRRVDLADLVPELRFGGANPVESLDVEKPLGRQLQTMRLLTPEAAKQVRDRWNTQLQRDEEEFVQASEGLADLGAADRRAEVLVRKEQGKLRRLLFGDARSATCVLCGRSYPVSLLVAAHIKPRAECTLEERNDWRDNVVPMCCFGCDALFERRIVFVRDGKIKLAANGLGSAVDTYLKQLRGQACAHWSENSAKYFEWHAARAQV